MLLRDIVDFNWVEKTKDCEYIIFPVRCFNSFCLSAVQTILSTHNYVYKEEQTEAGEAILVYKKVLA